MGVLSVPGAAVEQLRNTGSFMTPEPTGFFEVGLKCRVLRIRPPNTIKSHSCWTSITVESAFRCKGDDRVFLAGKMVLLARKSRSPAEKTFC
jgi:hypothetical protein